MHLHNVHQKQCPTYSLLMSHVHASSFSGSVRYLPKLHQHCLLWITLSALRENKHLLCNFQCLESPCVSRDSSRSPSGEPPFRLMTFRCDIGHIANCIHWPKISLCFPIPSHSPCFTPASGQRRPWSMMFSIGGVVHFKGACSPPSLSTTNPNWQIPPPLFFFVGIVFLLTFQGCGSEGFVYRGIDVCRHNVTCSGLGWNLSPMQPDRQGLLVWREAQAVLHVTVTLCVKSRCGDFTNESANECTANRRSHMRCFGCNWAGESLR